MNRSAKIGVSIGLTLLILSLIITSAYLAPPDSGKIYYEYGELERERINQKSTSVVIVADSFTISKEELSITIREELLKGLSEEEAIASAEKILLEKYLIYHLALKNGLKEDPEAAKELLEYNKQISKTASNYEDFQSFLNGIGMSHDDYWDSQLDNFIIYDVIGRYKCMLKENLMCQVGELSESEWTSYFLPYWENMVKREMEAEHVHYVTYD